MHHVTDAAQSMRRREFYSEEIDARTEVSVSYPTTSTSATTSTYCGVKDVLENNNSVVDNTMKVEPGLSNNGRTSLVLLIALIAAAAVIAACLFIGDQTSFVVLLPPASLLIALIACYSYRL